MDVLCLSRETSAEIYASIALQPSLEYLFLPHPYLLLLLDIDLHFLHFIRNVRSDIIISSSGETSAIELPICIHNRINAVRGVMALRKLG